MLTVFTELQPQLLGPCLTPFASHNGVQYRHRVTLYPSPSPILTTRRYIGSMQSGDVPVQESPEAIPVPDSRQSRRQWLEGNG